MCEMLDYRPIDANALLDHFRRRYIGRDLKSVENDGFYAFLEAKDIIEAAPTIAGVGIYSTGGWLTVGRVVKRRRCAACGAKSLETDNFCNSCGAQMDESEKIIKAPKVRPIDARALVDAFTSRYFEDGPRYVEKDIFYTYWIATGIIYRAPTIDSFILRPLGRWIYTGNIIKKVKCSCCNAVAYTEKRYCPKCGAEMENYTWRDIE